MRLTLVLCAALAASPCALLACSDESSPSDAAGGTPGLAGQAGNSALPGDGGAKGGIVDGGAGPAELAGGAAGEGTDSQVTGGATGANGGAGGGSGSEGGETAAGGAPLTPAEYDALICTQRFAFAEKARQAVAPTVSQFNQCALASDCTEKAGLQLGCPGGNSFWLGNYVVRSDSQQAFLEAIADVASGICDDAPSVIRQCTMGGITLPHSVICDTGGRCGVKY